MIKPVAASGLSESELQMILQIIPEALPFVDWEELDERFTSITVEFESDSSSISLHQTPDAVVGATGRALLLSIDDQLSGEGMDEVIQYVLSQSIDQQLYSEEQTLLKQPILVSIQQAEALSEIDLQEFLEDLIQDQIFMYEMTTALPMSAEISKLPESNLIPTEQVEMDGDFVTDVWSQEQVWDTSSILVFDNLVSDDLRKRLLDVTLGGTSETWDDVENGPNPKRWVRGGLIDTPDEDEYEATATTPSASWGLLDEAIDDICFHHHDAIQDFECILSQLFPQFAVTRLPEAVFGGSVSPLTANAPTFKDEFSIHIDGDPNQTPPSPWTDVYGRYPNRIRGKPRFMSCLLYLNDEWEEDWGAQTRFLDLPTDKLYGVNPKPGRIVLMDQDCSHTVVAPNESAGNRPRYSLVWKLILHPRENFQDMTDLAVGRPWPVPTLFGSAKEAKQI
ncbi:MAG: hypothetical protein SGBAC_002386 [Bacillariaceae sp.]